MIQILLAFTIVCASPGPANLALATLAMARGFAAAARMALGLALGLAVWGVFAGAGLGAALAASGTALFTLKLCGAAYLIWLAIRAARAASRADASVAESSEAGRSDIGWFLRGLALNLSNPKAVLAWMAALAVGLDPESGAAAVSVATLACIAIGFANYAAWALIFSRGQAMAFYRRARRGVEAFAALGFAAAGAGLLRSASSR